MHVFLVVYSETWWHSQLNIWMKAGRIIDHLFNETEGNSVFWGPETAVVARGEAERNNVTVVEGP
jgi:hypothetical protein